MRGQSRTLALKVGQPPSRVLQIRFPPPDGTTHRLWSDTPHDSVVLGMSSSRESSVATDAARTGSRFHLQNMEAHACCWLGGCGWLDHPCAGYASHASFSRSRLRQGDGALRSQRGQFDRKGGRRRRPFAARLRESWCPLPRHQVGARCGPGRRDGRADADGLFRPRPGSRSADARPLRRSRHGDDPLAEITAQLAHIASWEGFFITPIPEPRIVVPTPAETERISSPSPHKERKP